jgi:hypothetical protein
MDMESVAPPRGALNLLTFFAGEPDFTSVIGDLSEEFQHRVSTHGHGAARHWYWRESIRNASAFGKRELRRTPIRVLAVTLLVFLLLLTANFFGSRLLVDIKWAWIPPRFWHLYRLTVLMNLFDLALLLGAGAALSRFLKARELSLVVTFVIATTCAHTYMLYGLTRNYAFGRPGLSLLQVSLLILLGWALTVIAYSVGCLWIRWRRLA